jgi:hypothetical protein
MNMETGKYYTLYAEQLAEGNKCVVWAEIGSGVTAVLAQQVASEYDNKIRPMIVGAFGEKNITEDFNNNISYKFDDILDYANWLADGNDKKLTILLLDIKDGFKNPNTDPYVAGYFSPVNFFESGRVEISGGVHYSNGRDMIYIDTVPSLENESEETYATLAHELQHLINFVTSYRHRMEETDMGLTLFTMDTWIDEGLSAYAEYLYYGKNPPDKCEWFSEDPKGTIAKGNNFFVWGNHSDARSAILDSVILDDYATVYLFFRWLYLQANDNLKSRILLDIETSKYYDFRAVTDVVDSDWETLLKRWLAANYDPRNSDYGYKDDPYLQKNIKVKPIGEAEISLYPGEGVYSIINTDLTRDKTGNIHYAGLRSNIIPGPSFSPDTADVLLTFNANTTSYIINGNTISEPAPETGSLTGVPVPASRQQARAVQSSINGSYRIDARDLLGRNRERKLPGVLGPFRNKNE